MTEIQQLLTNTIDELNVKEKRDNRPRFSISFIRNHPWLFVAMYAAFLATFVVMLTSETLADSVWLLVVLFALLNGFFFFDVYPRYRYEDIDVLDFRVLLQRGVVQHAICPSAADRTHYAVTPRGRRAENPATKNGGDER